MPRTFLNSPGHGARLSLSVVPYKYCTTLGDLYNLINPFPHLPNKFNTIRPYQFNYLFNGFPYPISKNLKVTNCAYPNKKGSELIDFCIKTVLLIRDNGIFDQKLIVKYEVLKWID